MFQNSYLGDEEPEARVMNYIQCLIVILLQNRYVLVSRMNLTSIMYPGRAVLHSGSDSSLQMYVTVYCLFVQSISE